MYVIYAYYSRDYKDYISFQQVTFVFFFFVVVFFVFNFDATGLP